MSQIGFKCSFYGEMKHEDCRACSLDPMKQKCQYSAVMLERMREKPDPEREGMYSPTKLIDCFRKSVLLKDEDYYADPDDLWAMERGNIFHAYLGELPYPGALQTYVERRLYLDLETKYGPARFGGKPDLVAVFETGAKIIDWKSASELKHDYIMPYDDHVIQLNCYKWLVEENYKIKVTELELNAISMVRPRRFSSVSELTTRGKMTKRTLPKEYEILTLSKIPMIENEEVKAWVIERIEQKIEAETVMPPVLGEEDLWRCIRCPVRVKCQKQALSAGNSL